MVMELTVHASDISNPGKPFDIYKEWTFRILEEFWNQVIFYSIPLSRVDSIYK